MINKRSFPLMACVAILPVVWFAACNDDDNTTAPTLPPQVAELRASLEPYTSLAVAKAAGYSTGITDCMANGDEGAMGVHFGKTSLFDAVADRLKPELLIYEPSASGEMSLVGVEFIVPYTAVPKTAAAPELFGQKFTANDGFELWGLHVWTHRANPAGLFAPWNTRVRC